VGSSSAGRFPRPHTAPLTAELVERVPFSQGWAGAHLLPANFSWKLVVPRDSSYTVKSCSSGGLRKAELGLSIMGVGP
jgi:hypothetical protein